MKLSKMKIDQTELPPKLSFSVLLPCNTYTCLQGVVGVRHHHRWLQRMRLVMDTKRHVLLLVHVLGRSILDDEAVPCTGANFASYSIESSDHDFFYRLHCWCSSPHFDYNYWDTFFTTQLPSWVVFLAPILPWKGATNVMCRHWYRQKT